MEEVQIRKNRALFYLSVLWDDSSSAEKSRGVSLGLDPLSWLLWCDCFFVVSFLNALFATADKCVPQFVRVVFRQQPFEGRLYRIWKVWESQKFEVFAETRSDRKRKRWVGCMEAWFEEFSARRNFPPRRFEDLRVSCVKEPGMRLGRGRAQVEILTLC